MCPVCSYCYLHYCFYVSVNQMDRDGESFNREREANAMRTKINRNANASPQELIWGHRRAFGGLLEDQVIDTGYPVSHREDSKAIPEKQGLFLEWLCCISFDCLRMQMNQILSGEVIPVSRSAKYHWEKTAHESPVGTFSIRHSL